MSPTGLKLSLEACCERQKRIGRLLAERDLDFALLIRPEHVQYVTGFRPAAVHQAAVVVFPDGKTVLAAPNSLPDHFEANEVLVFEAQWCCTLRQDQLAAALAAITSKCFRNLNGKRAGVERSVNLLTLTPWFPPAQHSAVDIEPDLWNLRRCKDEDELVLIQHAIQCTDEMYYRAREIIVPGITEIEVYNQLHAAAMNFCGAPFLAFGNDFQCNSPGGPPRTRPTQTGELYILDLGVSCTGYYSDSCRTFSVDQCPTDEQLRAAEHIERVLTFVEQSVRPGTSARELFIQAKAMLDEAIPGGFFHHLGHGIGLFPHEAPHLNEHWDDHFQPGDVFTAEPGLYSHALKAGIRLEQNYLITDSGATRLTNFPIDL